MLLLTHKLCRRSVQTIMTGRAAFPLVDKALGGQLEAELRRLRGEKQSYESIGRWLLTEHGIEVSTEMVRRWVRALPEPEAAAS